MNTKTKTKELHIRISKDFEDALTLMAKDYGFSKSTFARAILERTLPQYTRNRFFG